MEILRHTPAWVFILFAVLLGFGIFQSRPRVSSHTRIAILPVAMLLLSLYGVFSAFGISAVGIGAWSAGVGVACALNQALALPRGARFSVATESLEIPGSWVPLALMMAIFFTKYAVSVALALRVQLAELSPFVAGVGFAYGLASGLFFARLLRLWSIAKQRTSGVA